MLYIFALPFCTSIPETKAQLPLAEAKPVTLITFTGILVLTIIPFTPIANALGLISLPLVYFLFLAVTIVAYMCVATLLKHLYIKKYNEWL